MKYPLTVRVDSISVVEIDNDFNGARTFVTRVEACCTIAFSMEHGGCTHGKYIFNCRGTGSSANEAMLAGLKSFFSGQVRHKIEINDCRYCSDDVQFDRNSFVCDFFEWEDPWRSLFTELFSKDSWKVQVELKYF